MPLDVVRLRDSDLAAIETAEAFRAAVMLWCSSWHQLPAASLPDDDRVLANLAGYGRVVREWQKEREGALRGWVKCSDGRLYHPVVAEKAVEAWRGKLERQWRTECARIKKHAQRHEITAECPEFEAWIADGRPQGQTLHVPEDKRQLSPETHGERPQLVPEETPSKGQGEGQGEGQGQIDKRDSAAAQRPSRPKREEITLATYLANCKAAGIKPLPADHAIREYCRDAQITDEMLQVAWCVFRDDYQAGTNKAKRYKDWPGHFANAVRGGWYKLWFTDAGEVKWSSRGLTEKAVLDARAQKAQAAKEAHDGVPA